MIDIRYKFPNADVEAVGEWLDEIMPNPILTGWEEDSGERRWLIGSSEQGQFGIRFYNDVDATMFALRWIKE